MTRIRRWPALAALALVLIALLASCGRDTAVAPDEVAKVPAPAEAMPDSFKLRVYGADAVYLAGNFNGWSANDADYAFTYDGDGYTWRFGTTLPAGVQAYKLVLHKDGQTTWITDPMATEIEGGGDPSQANALYGRALPAIDDLPEPIDRTRLVIYEIAPNDFSTAGNFAGIIAGLDSGPHLTDLGVNAIELMPPTAPSYNGWGYDPVLYAAPNPAYGSPYFFALLVDRAHERGMAVILDMVLNHAAGGSVLRQLDTFSGQYNFTTTESNPWGLVELNWSDPALRAHILDAVLHWVETYKVDGFRFDYIAGESWETWEWLRDQLRDRHPHLLLIGEDYRYPVDGNAVTHGYDAQWGGNHTDQWGGGGNNFLQVMTTNLTQNGFAWRGSAVTDLGCWSYACRNMWATANVIGANSQYNGSNGDGFSDVKYFESHDENRAVWAVETYGAAGAQAVGGVQKSELGAYALLTSVGIPMLYTGQEIGSGEYRPELPETYKIDWTGGDQDLRAVYRNLIRLRLEHPALQMEQTWFHWRDNDQDHFEATLCYWRGGYNPESAEIVVALNFDDEAHTRAVPFPADGPWRRFDPRTDTWTLVEVVGGQLTVEQPASSGALWKKVVPNTGVPDWR
jgi:1,4-alpha-glucan branching enzyme